MLKAIILLNDNNSFVCEKNIISNIDIIKDFLKNKNIIINENYYYLLKDYLNLKNSIVISKNINILKKVNSIISDYRKLLKLSTNKNYFIICDAQMLKLMQKHVDQIIILKLHNTINSNLSFDIDLRTFKLIKKTNDQNFELQYFKNYYQKILFGQPIVNSLIENQKIQFKQLISKGIIPNISIINIGNSKASEIYINNKLKYAQLLGVKIDIFQYDHNVEEWTIISKIKQLNDNDNVNGIMIQLPLPKHLNTKTILNTISKHKDIDCLNDKNFSKLMFYQPKLIPCTPKAIFEIFKYYNIDIEAKKIVILGRSIIVGFPLSLLLINKNSTVTICNSYSKNINKILSEADIIISSISKVNFLKAYNIKKGSIIIDVSTNYLNNKLVGDADFNNVIHKVKYITPVPGGIGPITVAMCFENLLYLLKH